MTVQDLIRHLEEVKDKTVLVYRYNEETGACDAEVDEVFPLYFDGTKALGVK